MTAGDSHWSGAVDVLAVNGGAPVRDRPYPWPIHGDAERRLLLEVLESGKWAFDGPKESELAHTFSERLSGGITLLVSSGTVALEIAVQALNFEPGAEILVPALTWTAPAHAVVVGGCVPRFVDIDPTTWCIDPIAAEAAVTDRTRAILVVHTYAHVADMDSISDIAARHGLFVIEDCAHALGSEWRGRPVGTLGDMGCFSFHQSKNITAGEGGMVVTSNTELGDRIYELKNCGRMRQPEGLQGFGGNARMTEFQAAVLLAQLSRLDEQITIKAESVNWFAEKLAETPGVRLSPAAPHVTRRNFFGLPVIVAVADFAKVSTDRLVTALAYEGMPVFLPHPVVYQSPSWQAGIRYSRYRDRLGLDAKCPIAERIAGQAGIVLAHEIFLSSHADIEQVAVAIDKVRRLAHSIPQNVHDSRKL